MQGYMPIPAGVSLQYVVSRHAAHVAEENSPMHKKTDGISRTFYKRLTTSGIRHVENDLRSCRASRPPCASPAPFFRSRVVVRMPIVSKSGDHTSIQCARDGKKYEEDCMSILPTLNRSSSNAFLQAFFSGMNDKRLRVLCVSKWKSL